MSEDKFTYSYSPSRNAEADRIAAKYIDLKPEPDSDLERLRRLDRKTEMPATFAGIVTGLLGVLLIGTGLSLILSLDHFAAGLITGIIGLVMTGIAPVVSRAVLVRSREKAKDEILALTEKIKSSRTG